MEKDLGYQDILVMARRLEDRANVFAAEADASQAKGLTEYALSQAASLAAAQATLDTNRQEFLRLSEECLATADETASLRLLEAYGRYGVKEN